MGKATKITFGKYNGKTLKQVPLTMIGWLLLKYKGNTISKEEIEKEAIRRGCEQVDGRWGIYQHKLTKKIINPQWKPLANGSEYHSDFLGNTIVRHLRDDWYDADYGDDIYDYEGIPNFC